MTLSTPSIKPTNGAKYLVLAPMEGLADWPMRQLLTEQAGFDWTVSEFIRVTDQLLPKRVFYRSCPELQHPTKTPIRLQLLGSQPDAMAANAERALELGSYGLDLNFGCPSKTVNNSCGGAMLLKSPQSIEEIITAVRRSVPSNQVLSAKVRLGFYSINEIHDILSAVINGGANQVVIHARTKEQGYRPPAFWWKIRELTKPINVIVNGEIWNSHDYWQALSQSHCQHAMLGRGVISDPDLIHKIRAMQLGQSFKPRSWLQMCQDLEQFVFLSRERMPEKYIAGRLKQWLKHLGRHWPEARACLERIRTLTQADSILEQAKEMDIQQDHSL